MLKKQCPLVRQAIQDAHYSDASCRTTALLPPTPGLLVDGFTDSFDRSHEERSHPARPGQRTRVRSLAFALKPES